MSEKEVISENIRKYFKANGNRKFVILPFRNLSGMVSDILYKEFNIHEQFVVDNNAYDMEHIYPMNQMPEGYKECTFLLAAYGDTKKALCKQLLEYVAEDKIVDLLVDEEREQVFNSNDKVHIDFLCPGFVKCGTTSLQYALAKNSKVFLPRVKETYFLRYSVNNTSHENFKKHYRIEDTAGKIVGDIDPAYRSNAEDVYRYFGKDLKLIFCVRNPINALYSYFKMEMRSLTFMLESKTAGSEMMEGYDQVSPEMFDKWARKYRYRQRYSDYIKSFLKYYPKEQVKIIVSEELYADAYSHMDDLQDFLGIPEEDKLEYQEFPKENVGNTVSKDQKGLEINIGIGQLQRRLMKQGDFQSLDLLEDIRTKVEEITMTDYSEPMWDSTRQMLLDYYRDSIHELEGILGRSLQGIWYS